MKRYKPGEEFREERSSRVAMSTCKTETVFEGSNNQRESSKQKIRDNFNQWYTKINVTGFFSLDPNAQVFLLFSP